MTEFVQQRLKLGVNLKKSSVRHASQAVILGFRFFFRGNGDVAIGVSHAALRRVRQRVKGLSGRSWRIAMRE